jgi:hypothetical protein
MSSRSRITYSEHEGQQNWKQCLELFLSTEAQAFPCTFDLEIKFFLSLLRRTAFLWRTRTLFLRKTSCELFWRDSELHVQVRVVANFQARVLYAPLRFIFRCRSKIELSLLETFNTRRKWREKQQQYNHWERKNQVKYRKESKSQIGSLSFYLCRSHQSLRQSNVTGMLKGVSSIPWTSNIVGKIHDRLHLSLWL